MDHDFVLQLRNLGVILRNEKGRLLCNAPKGVLTPELQEQIRIRKQDLLAVLYEVDGNGAPLLPPMTRTAVRDGAPMTFAQQRLWFLDQLQPGSSAYNMSWALEIRGELNAPLFERAVNEIVRRHDILRAGFMEREGQGWQFFRPALDLKLVPLPLSALTGEAGYTSLHDHLRMEAGRPFDLGKDPLIRCRLIRAEEHRHIFFLVIHHIVFDGWSFDIFIQELFSFYASFRRGEPVALPERNFQYADFAYWQHTYLDDTELTRQLEFWKAKLSGAPAHLDLPIDHPRPPTQTFNGAQLHAQVDARLAQAARDMARGQNASLFMVLLGVFKLVLHRLSGQSDIVIGSPFAGRRQKETEDLLGFFVNTVVLRTDLSGEPTFAELLSRVRDVVLEAQVFQDMPFERIVEALAPQREMSRTPLFQIFFNHITTLLDRPQDGSLDIGVGIFDGYQGELQAKFDLTFYVEEFASTLRLRMVYNADLFSPERMESLLEQYLTVLEQAVAHPERKISSYTLIGAKSRTVLPDLSQVLECDAGESVILRMARCAQAQPAHTAVEDRWNRFSYEELEHLSNRLARRLETLGITGGDVVAIYGHRSAGLVVALLAIMKARAAFLILDPGYPARRLLSMLEDAAPRGLIRLEAAGEIDPAVSRRDYICRLTLPRGKGEMLRDLASHSEAPLAAVPEADQTAYLIFTSGTTGRPKGIIGTHRPLNHFLEWHCNRFAFRASDRFSMLSGLAHDPLLRDIFAPLWAGAALCIPDADQMLLPGYLRAWMRRENVTVAHLTPALGHVLAEGEEAALPALRYLFFGGDTLSPRTVDGFRRFAPEACCVNFYGATETPQAMGYHVIDPKDAKHRAPRVPVGRGIDGAQLAILNFTGDPAGVGELGEVCIRTPYLSEGYLNDPKLTAEKFMVNRFGKSSRDRIYRTGDLGRHLPDGQVMLYGRRDSQVSIRGFRIELKEIEAILAAHAGVGDCAVIAKERNAEERNLVAFLVPHNGSDFSPDSLRLYLQQNLPDYMIPTAFVPVSEIPLTPNSKVDIRKLEALRSEPDERIPTQLPQTPMQKEIAAIWKQVLEIETVNLHDNFFNVGGHSLLSIQVISKFEKRTGLKMRPADLIYQTLGQLASNYETIQNDSKSLTKTSEIKPLYAISPKFFRVDKHQLFSCYHHPDSSVTKNVAVLLCNPVGQEYIKSHRSFVQLAIRLADAGFPVMRFDYFGTGDSAGDFEETDIDHLRQDIWDAIEELKSKSNKQIFCLAGLRLGATMAAMVAMDRSDIDSLMLWEPVMEGHRYIEELKISHSQMLKYSYVDEKLASPNELLGYPKNLKLLEGISKINLIETYKTKNHIRHFLLLKSSTESEIDKFKSHFMKLSPNSAYLESFCPDVWAEEVFKQLVPSRLLESVVGWLKRAYP
jgi:amino acid adenylation domain-containing protein